MLLHKDKYTVAIIGAGTIGLEIAEVASEIKGLERILMTTPHSSSKIRTKAEVIETRKRSNAEIQEVRYDEEGFGLIRAESDIAIIALHNSGMTSSKLPMPQLELLQANMGIIQNVAKQFEGYQGAVIVVTNPTDVLSYYVAQISGIDPTQVMGFNHVDQTRGTAAIRRWLRMNQTAHINSAEAPIEFYSGGAHFRGGRALYYLGVGRRPASERADYSKLVSFVRQGIDDYGEHEMKQEDTRSSTGIAMKEVLEALIRGKKDARLDLSVYVQLNGREPVFIGWPTKVDELRAHPDFTLKPQSDGDQTIFFNAYDRIEHSIKNAKMGEIISGEPFLIGQIEKRAKTYTIIPMQRFSEDISVFANAGRGILQWNISKPNEPKELPLQLENAVTELTQGTLQDSDILFAATRKKVVGYDLKSGKPIEIWDNPANGDVNPGIHFLAYSPVQGAVYWARSDGRVFRRGIGDHSLDEEISDIRDTISSGGLVNANGRTELVLGGNKVHFIDVHSGKVETVSNLINNTLVRRMSVFGSQIYFINTSTHLYRYDRENPQHGFEVVNLNATPLSLSVLDGGTKVAISSGIKGIRIFEAMGGLHEAKPLENSQQHQSYHCLAQAHFDHSNYLIAAEGHLNGPRHPGNYSIHVFDLESLTGKPALTLTGGTSGITAMEAIHNASANT